MAFHLIHADGRSLLASDRPLLRAAERQPVEEAATLLDEVRDWHDRQGDALAAARAVAAAEGRQAGEADGRAAFATAIATLTDQAQADALRRDEDIAALALAALRQMIGALPDETVMSGVARRAVETLGSRGPVLVEVSEAMLPHVERAFADRPSPVEVAVRAQEGLTDDQCRLTAPDGRIVADLDVQIQSFATRWEVADAL
jgi:flagellar biosynthesis/type III secretory pathway protein FliH